MGSIPVQLIGLSVFLSVFADPSPAQAMTVASDIVYTQREGVPAARNSLDIYRANTDTDQALLPVMIMIHGGGWQTGDKASQAFAKTKAEWLVEQGWVVVSINYRFSPEHTHPAHIEDVAAAMAWVQAHIEAYGGNPDQIHLLGHSAGAHLAALAALDRDRIEGAGADPDAIRSVVLLDGAGYDLPPRIRRTTGTRAARMYRAAFTDDPAVQRDASPVYHISVGQTLPAFLIVYVAERQASSMQTAQLAEALRSAGGRVETAGLIGESHASVNRELGIEGKAVTRVVGAFLESEGHSDSGPE